MTAGSWSLEDDGKLVTLRQNPGRCCGFTSEGKRLLMWLQNEEHMNEPLVVELHERGQVEAQNNGRHSQLHNITTVSLILLLIRCIHYRRRKVALGE